MSWEAWGDPPEAHCQMCGCEPGSCICPECTVCGEVGDPACYRDHGVVETEEQVQSRIVHDPNNDPWDWPLRRDDE